MVVSIEREVKIFCECQTDTDLSSSKAIFYYTIECVEYYSIQHNDKLEPQQMYQQIKNLEIVALFASLESKRNC